MGLDVRFVSEISGEAWLMILSLPLSETKRAATDLACNGRQARDLHDVMIDSL